MNCLFLLPDERHKEIKLDTATFVFIMISLVTCVADVLARRVTKSSHAFCVRFMWYVTGEWRIPVVKKICLGLTST